MKKFDYMTSVVDEKTLMATHRAGKDSLKFCQKSLFFIRIQSSQKMNLMYKISRVQNRIRNCNKTTDEI